MIVDELQFTAPPARSPGLQGRVEHAVARWLLGLSASAQRRLAGGDPPARGGLALHSELHLMLRAQKLAPMRNALTAGSLLQARARMRRDCIVHEGAPIEVGSVRDLTFDARSGRLRARHYAPARVDGSAPLCVFFHGGGFVMGDLETHDAPCRFLCKHAGVHVLSIDYRLAPEHPFPAGPEDALDGFRFGVAHAARLGADPTRIGVAGDSAGGNLSAVVALMARDHGERIPDFATLIYPVVDFKNVYPSHQLFARDLLLTGDDKAFFDAQYFGNDDLVREDPRLSPLLASDLSALCPTLVVTAGFDLLRDEGEAYADALQKASNRVFVRREPDLLHGFINLLGLSPACRAACMRIAEDLRDLARG